MMCCLAHILRMQSKTILSHSFLPAFITLDLSKQADSDLLLQLLVQHVWNLCFFKARNPGWAMMCCIAYILLLHGTAVLFHWLLPTAALLLLPACVWSLVLFVWSNFVWRKNRAGRADAALEGLVDQVSERVDEIGNPCITCDILPNFDCVCKFCVLLYAATCGRRCKLVMLKWVCNILLIFSHACRHWCNLERLVHQLLEGVYNTGGSLCFVAPLGSCASVP